MRHPPTIGHVMLPRARLAPTSGQVLVDDVAPLPRYVMVDEVPLGLRPPQLEPYRSTRLQVRGAAVVGRRLHREGAPVLVACRGERYISQFKNTHAAEVWSGFEEGSYSRLIDRCITQL